MYSWLFPVFMLFACCLCPLAPAHGQSRLQIQSGSLDLKGVDVSKDDGIQLEGEWGFVPERLLTPREALTLNNGTTLKVPGPWNEVRRSDGQPFGAHGYGTYLLKISSLNADLLYGLRLPYATSSYSLYWFSSENPDVAPLLSNGTVGTSAQTSIPQFFERTTKLPVDPNASAHYLLIHVANYHWVHGGLFRPPVLGPWQTIENTLEVDVGFSLITLGLLIMMFLYTLSIYSRQRHESGALWLALICLVIIGINIVGVGSVYYRIVSPSVLSHAFHRYAQSGAGPLGVAFLYEFNRSQYASVSRQWVRIMIWSIAGGLAFMFLVSPFGISVWALRLVQASVLFIAACVLQEIVRAYRAKLEASHLTFAATLVLMGGVMLSLMSRILMFKLPEVFTLSAVGFIFLQSQVLGFRFSKLFYKTKRLSEELSAKTRELETEHAHVVELNRTLEERVSEQTREVKSIMQHVPIGIFAVYGSELRIQKDYSLQLETLFDKKDLQDEKAIPLLLANTRLSDDDKQQIENALYSCMGEIELNFRFNEHLLPSQLSRTGGDGEEHQFELSWNPVLNQKKETEKVLVTIKDVTELRRMEISARQQSDEISVLNEIIAVKDAPFRRFYLSCETLLKQNWELLERMHSKAQNKDALKMLFINMHTMKGMARTFYLRKFSSLLHQMEQYYSELNKDPKPVIDLNRIHSDLQNLQETLHQYRRIAEEKLGRSFDGAAVTSLPVKGLRKAFEGLQAYLRKLTPDVSLLAPVYNLLQDSLTIKIQDLFQEIFAGVPALARDLGKQLPHIQVELPLVSVNNEVAEILSGAFIHLIRNTMDHGIEPASERLAAGKKAEGMIHVKASLESDGFYLEVSDDGRGLNLGKILVLGQSKGILKADATDGEIAAAIFAPGMSTADEVSEISGRGIGMNAVREYLQRLEGDIEIAFLAPEKAGFRPFAFRIRLPRVLFCEEFGAKLQAPLEQSA